MNIKKIVSTFLSVCCTTSIFVTSVGTTVHASPETRVTNSESSAHELAIVKDILGAPEFSVPARAIFKSDFPSDSRYRGAYCVERVKPSPTGQTYTKGEYVDDGFYTIIKNGFPYNTSASMGMKSDRDAMYVTQLAIWAYLENWDISKVQMNDPTMLPKFKELVSKGRSAELTQDYSVGLNSDTIEATQDGDKMIAGPFEVNTDNVKKGTYTVKLKGSHDGLVVKSSTGEVKDTFDKDEPFYIEAPVTTPTSEIDFSIRADFYRERAIKYMSPSPLVQHVVTLEEDPEIMLLNGSVEITRPEGTVNIIKKDEKDGKPLAGATFQIKDESKGVIETITTDDSGTISTKLPVGKYFYQEIESPTGYVIDNGEYPFEITLGGEVKNIDVTNKKITGTLELTKKDIATGELLPNTEFIIRNEAGQEVTSGVTDENGVARFTLEYGKYTYQELNAPEGYVIDESEFPFEITEDGKIVKAEMTNKKIRGKLVLTKKDISTGDLLPNAEFIIRNEAGEEVANGITDENGEATFELEYGKYTYQEFNAPEGYIIDESEFPFEIKQDGEIIKAVMENKPIKGKINIIKVDKESEVGLEGAVFNLFDKEGNVIKEVTTDKDGYAVIDELLYGEYILKEVAAPNGYILSEEPVQINIIEDGQEVEVIVTNEKIEEPIIPGLPDTSGIGDKVKFISIIAIAIGVVFVFMSKRD